MSTPASDLSDVFAHDTLFDVYVRRDTANASELFAIGQCGDKVIVVERTLKGGTRLKESSFSAAITQLAGRLKLGYEKQSQRKYYNPRGDAFTNVHPDVDWKGENWLLAATPPSVTDAAEAVAAKVATLSADLILPEEIQGWRNQQRLNSKHIVSFADHPAWSLAIAQLALERGWGLRASPGLSACPDTPPSMAPMQWAAWLVPTFNAKAVDANQAGFGWTVGHLIISDSASSNSGGLSALL